MACGHHLSKLTPSSPPPSPPRSPSLPSFPPFPSLPPPSPSLPSTRVCCPERHGEGAESYTEDQPLAPCAVSKAQLHGHTLLAVGDSTRIHCYDMRAPSSCRCRCACPPADPPCSSWCTCSSQAMLGFWFPEFFFGGLTSLVSEWFSLAVSVF